MTKEEMKAEYRTIMGYARDKLEKNHMEQAFLLGQKHQILEFYTKLLKDD